MTPPPTCVQRTLPPDALALLDRLNEERVEYVLIGELAAAVHGCAWADETVAIVPARFGRNLDRLVRALRAVGAQLRLEGQTNSLPVELSAESLRKLGHWTMRSQLGDVEIDFEPPATAGHIDLFESARRVALTPRLEVEVAAPEDLVRIAEMRQSAADQALLAQLRAVAAGSPRTHEGSAGPDASDSMAQ